MQLSWSLYSDSRDFYARKHTILGFFNAVLSFTVYPAVSTARPMFFSDHYLLLTPFIVGRSHFNQHAKRPRLFTELRSLENRFSRLLFAHYRENYPFLPEIIYLFVKSSVSPKTSWSETPKIISRKILLAESCLGILRLYLHLPAFSPRCIVFISALLIFFSPPHLSFFSAFPVSACLLWFFEDANKSPSLPTPSPRLALPAPSSPSRHVNPALFSATLLSVVAPLRDKGA